MSLPGGGSCAGRCAVEVGAGERIALEAWPDEGGRFLGWSGRCGGQGACEVVVEGPGSLKATFGEACPEPWGLRLGGAGAAVVEQVAVAPGGEVVIAGSFEDRVEIGGVALEAGGSAGFVARFSGQSCGLRWADVIGGAATGLALDGSGNALVAGAFEGAMEVGGRRLEGQGGRDLYLAKLAGANGAALWLIGAGGAGIEREGRVAAGAGGRIFWGGAFEGEASAAGGRIVSEGGADVFVASIRGSDGGRRWSRRFGGSGDESLGALAAVEGGVGLAGGFVGRLEPGGLVGAHAGVGAIFALGLEGEGGRVSWGAALSSELGGAATGLASDGAGGAVVSGRIEGAMEIGGGRIEGGQRQLVARLRGDGSVAWARSWEGGGVGGEAGPGVVLGEGGEKVFVFGGLGAAGDLGWGEVSPLGEREVYVVGFDVAEGSALGGRLLGNGGRGQARSAAAEGGGGVVLVGSFEGEAGELGDGEAAEGVDGFLIRLEP